MEGNCCERKERVLKLWDREINGISSKVRNLTKYLAFHVFLVPDIQWWGPL
jgi:hypothetical protein